MDGFNVKHSKVWIITTVIVAAAIINPDFFFGALGTFISALSPIFIGMTIAFILNRPVCGISSILQRFSDSRVTKSDSRTNPLFCCTKTGVVSKESRYNAAWIISVIICYILLLLALAGIVWIIVPQLINSIKVLISNGDLYKEKFMVYYQALEKRDSLGIFSAITSAVQRLSEELPNVITQAYGKTADFIGCIADFAIGFVISIYILIDKKQIRISVQRFMKAILTQNAYQRTASFYRTVYDTFSLFVSGQITEAAVLGVLCFLGMTLFGFEYSLLISTIIGITALIPVVGAIVGTIPCAFLLFLVKPISAVWFIVFIIVLQQLENNLIYPKVVGKSMGLPPLTVLIAILLGAKLGGAAGILLAVPLMAVAYGIFKNKFSKE